MAGTQLRRWTDSRAAASMLLLVLLTAVACGGAGDAGPTTTGDVTPTVGDEGGPQTLEECVASEGWQVEEFDESTFPRLQDFLDANDIVPPVGVVEPQGPGFQFAALWVFDTEEDAETFAEALPIIALPPVGLAPQELLSVRSEGTVVVATTEDFSSPDALLKCG